MNVQPVDPRTVGGETPAVYHVYFWSDRRRLASEYVVEDAGDVREVLEWAEGNALGREIEIAVIVGGQAAYLIGPLEHTIDEDPSS